MLRKVSDLEQIRAHFARIRPYVSHKETSFSLHLSEMPGYAAFFLMDQNGKSVLEFNFIRELEGRQFKAGGRKGQPSAAFITDGSSTWIAHTGRVNRKHPKFDEPIVAVKEEERTRNYHVVASLSSPSLLFDLMAFHFSRLGDLVILPAEIHTDDGPSSPYTTRGSEKDPKHHLIVRELRKHLQQEGFSGWHHPASVKCDCTAMKDNKHFIFEAKPKTNFSTMCEAIGQLTVYDYLTANESTLVMVSPDEGMNDVIKRCLGRTGILHFACSIADKVVSFPVALPRV